jgi:hypothetical protein
MKLKSNIYLPEIKLIRSSLALMLLEIDILYPNQTITQIKRTQQQQDEIYFHHPDKLIREKYKLHPWQSVHQTTPIRGIDLRLHNSSRKLADYINSNWQYDHERPKLKCALIHDSGYGLHVHLQVHPNTKRKEV